MLKSLHIQNFRGFRDFRIDGFGRVNLIAGANNVGKTSLLEALYLNLSPTSLEMRLRSDLLRGSQGLSLQLEVAGSWGWLFYGKQFDKPIEITSESDDAFSPRRLTISWPGVIEVLGGFQPLGQSLQMKFQFGDKTTNTASALVETRNGSSDKSVVADSWRRNWPVEIKAVPVRILLNPRQASPQADANWFSSLDDVGRSGEIVEVLQILDGRLQDLALSMADNVPMVYCNIGIGRRVPLTQMGEGMVSLFSMLLEIANAPNGVVLIDEIESGLHHSVMVKVWRALAEAARKSNTQVFATTHSLETIRAAHIAFQENGIYDLCLYRLERRGADIKALAFDEESLGAAVEMNWEVR